MCGFPFDIHSFYPRGRRVVTTLADCGSERQQSYGRLVDLFRPCSRAINNHLGGPGRCW